jgi:glyoxylase-like metal-dependent hydrolase (beta-lactamase superfamily II)
MTQNPSKRMAAFFRRIVFFLVLLTVQAAHGGELTFTFIGNMAFHITDGKTTLLSDFPYTSGAYGYMEYDMDAVPKLKKGVSLITHFHGDHWNARLFEEMKHKVIAPPGVTKNLKPKRVVPFNKDSISYRDILVEPIEMPHKLAPEHFSYLVTWHGMRLYFTGDTETPADILKQKNIDVMFISPWLIRTIERQNLSLDTKHLVVYHQKIGEKFPPFQDYKRMKQGSSFSIHFEEN